MPFALVWSPLMMKIHKYKNAKAIFSKVAYFYFGFSLFFIFTSYIILEPLLKLLSFSPNFDDSLKFVPLLMFALALGSLQNIYSAGIVFARKPMVLAYIYTGTGILNLLISYYAVIYHGIIGIIFTFIFLRLITSAAIYFFSNKYFRFQIHFLDYLVLFILFILGFFIQIKYFYYKSNIIFLGVYIFIYFIFLFKSKILSFAMNLKSSRILL